MAITQLQFLNQVDYLLSADNSEFDEEARRSQIDSAAELYSHDLPDEITTDITGDAGKYYDIAAGLASWSEGFSQVLAIEYPAVTIANDETPTYLDHEDWDDDYWASGTRYLFLPNHAPAATEAIRVRYTAPYPLGTSGYDIPGQHFYAVSHLAAGLSARAIAAKYSRTSDSTISVDAVDHLSRAQQWSRRADEFIKVYREELNIQDDNGVIERPAGEFVDFDTEPSSARRYLFHGDR